MKPALLPVAPSYAPTQARLESDDRVARRCDAPDRAALLALDNVEAFFAGRPLPKPVI